jgi:hypothetical protein
MIWGNPHGRICIEVRIHVPERRLVDIRPQLGQIAREQRLHLADG